jgi:hypothetical protein
MKVIVQDAKTKRYLSATGRWVAAENDAQDFLSLVRAYNYATHFTSRRFEVVLYCPDDNYRTTIIEGEGKVADDFSEAVYCEHNDVATIKQAKQKKTSDSHQWSRFNDFMTSTRNHLN